MNMFHLQREQAVRMDQGHLQQTLLSKPTIRKF
jgi:hypothetical protein